MERVGERGGQVHVSKLFPRSFGGGIESALLCDGAVMPEGLESLIMSLRPSRFVGVSWSREPAGYQGVLGFSIFGYASPCFPAPFPGKDNIN